MRRTQLSFVQSCNTKAHNGTTGINAAYKWFKRTDTCICLYKNKTTKCKRQTKGEWIMIEWKEERKNASARAQSELRTWHRRSISSLFSVVSFTFSSASSTLPIHSLLRKLYYASRLYDYYYYYYCSVSVVDITYPYTTYTRHRWKLLRSPFNSS